MTPGYDAGGMWLHDPATAIRRLTEIGYRCVAVRPRRGSLDPSDSAFASQWKTVCDVANAANCELVIDTDTAFLHDPDIADPPSLIDPDQTRSQIAFDSLRKWIESASMLPGTVITFGASLPQTNEDHWTLDATEVEAQLERLATQVEPLIAIARDAGVDLALRPAIDAIINSVAAWERFHQWLTAPPDHYELGLAADTRQMIAAGEWPLAARLQRSGRALRVVYLSDIGSVDQAGILAVPRLLAGLREMSFQGPVIGCNEGRSSDGFAPAIQAASDLLNQA